MQLAPGQRRLQHVTCVHGAFSFTGTHHGMQFVDEQDDLAFLFAEIVQHGLEPLFELAPKFRTRDQRAQIQGKNSLRLQALGHLTVHNALGQTFDDGGLTYAGLADQDGVVLGASLQHLNGPANLVVAPDDGIEFALFRAGREIDRVLFQRLARVFRIGVIYRGTAPHLLDGFLDGAFDGTRAR